MASFRTAYLQRAIVQDAAVQATVNTDDASNTALAKAFALRQASPNALTAIKVGDLVVLTPATSTVPAYIVRTLSLAAATHMVAQSDVTQEYGHVPVENRDYRYFPMVNGTYAGPGAPTSTTPVKKIAIFNILDKTDIIIDPSQGETA